MDAEELGALLSKQNQAVEVVRAAGGGAQHRAAHGQEGLDRTAHGHQGHRIPKGTRLDLVDALLAAETALLNQTDNKDNTALHMSAHKARHEIIKRLVTMPDHGPARPRWTRRIRWATQTRRSCWRSTACSWRAPSARASAAVATSRRAS